MKLMMVHHLLPGSQVQSQEQRVQKLKHKMVCHRPHEVHLERRMDPLEDPKKQAGETHEETPKNSNCSGQS